MSWGVSHLLVRFGTVSAVDDVTLNVPPDQVTAVVGGDGAGKSTLLRALAGGLAPTSGEIRRPPGQNIGYMSETSGTYPNLSVQENLDFVAAAYGLDRGQARERAAGYLDRAGLAPFRHRLAGVLSGGMRQKLGVIGAMLHRPDLLILDEPTTGVDPVSRADLWWLISRAAAEGTAVVFATTYLDEADRASHLLVLGEGRAIAQGTPDDVIESMPGGIRELPDRPEGQDHERAWRRRGSWRIWDPDGTGVLEPDLQDAVVVMALRRELAHDTSQETTR